MAEYKLGDRGVTRDGRVAECIKDDEGLTYPLLWRSGNDLWWTTRDGRYCNGGNDHCDIVRLADDAKAEPEPAAAVVAKNDPPSTICNPASFSSDEHVIGGVHLMATTSGGKVSLWIDDKELSESEAAAVLRTIETVMEQARRAKEVVG